MKKAKAIKSVMSGTIEMKILKTSYLVLLAAAILSGCAFKESIKTHTTVSDERAGVIAPALLKQKQEGNRGQLIITAPYNGAVFPPEIAAPVFAWRDSTPGVQYWLVGVAMDGRPPFYQVTNEPQWLPIEDKWRIIKQNSLTSPAAITVIGFRNIDTPELVSDSSIQILTSKDRVDAMVLYRQVPLPCMVGEKNFRKIKWRLGDIEACGEPSVVMQDIPVCASCHQVTADGKTISMEMNYQNDGGAQFIADVQEDITLSEADFMTWSDFPKPAILPKTRGIFARMSPSGKDVVGTVNEIAYAALTNEPAFCQLFFPTYGILASYSVAKKTFQPLNGADDVAYTQTNPEWSPDEQQIAFARSETKNEYHEDIANIKTHIEDRGIEELNQRFPIQFDVWTLPFNKGDGGTPQPLKGASGNGMSNYFPRFSPDGRWIVYTRSKTGIMLQPDSELYIVPSGGGTARRMQCNLDRFNSWHSWSPNSRWLLFSSKANSIYTEIFITHIDENGNDSPPVCLSRFSDDRLAANLPEFVHRKAGQIKSIRIGK
jgi:hypothetical protein